MTRMLAVAATAAAMFVPASAQADQVITAGSRDMFTTPQVTIAQGEAVFFHNLDVDSHNVTASQLGPDGNPLFASQTAPAGAQVPVDGVKYLTSGSYQFLCTLHPFMTGTITVTSAGTPAPRPGATGAGPSAPSTPTAPGSPASTPTLATKPPGVQVSARRTASGLVRLRVSTTRAATVTIRLLSGHRVVAHRRVILTFAETRRVTLRAPRRRLLVRVTAVDPAGLAGSALTRVGR